MKIKIKNRWNKIIFSEEADGMRSVVEIAIKACIDLQDANLRGVALQNLDLRSANLRNADLRNANLREADLRNAYLRGANLRGADLLNADLRGADMRNVNLWGVNLQGADLGGANLLGAKWRGVDLDGVNLHKACLPTGETLENYNKIVVPELLNRGKYRVTAESWQRHSWSNCPMAETFGVKSLREIPARYRAKAEQFVQLFDGRHIPLPDFLKIEVDIK